MSLNNSNYGSGIIIFNGERLLIFYDHCDIKFEKYTSSNDVFSGTKSGSVYLTSHRIVFINRNLNDRLKSISMPFVTLKDVDIKQPIFGANRVEGWCKAEPNGGFQGAVQFSITFKHGGATEFGQAILEVGRRATHGRPSWQPAPDFFSIPAGASYYAAPPPAYAPPYNDSYYGFVPQHQDFSQPQSGQVFMYGAPPPYPGACPYPTSNNQQMPSPYTPNYPPQPQQQNGGGHSKEWEAQQNASQMPPAYFSTNNPHDVYSAPPYPSGAPYEHSVTHHSDLPPPQVNSAPSAPSAPPPAYSQYDKKKYN